MTTRHVLQALGLALVLLGGACATPEELDQDSSSTGSTFREPEPPSPWTTRFRTPTLAICDNAFIEGPKGLLDHLATRSEDGFHSYEAETLPAGFQQTFRVLRPEAGVELRAYLDAFEIVAFKELVVIERPGELDVRLHLSGDAYLRDGTTGEERRGPQLEVLGPIDEPSPAPR